jgi:hypothetical protein
VCADVTGVTEAEVEDGDSRIGPIGARLARDPIFTVIPPGAPFTCNIDNGNRYQVMSLTPLSLQPSIYPNENRCSGS